MARGNQIIKTVRMCSFLYALLLGAMALFTTGCLSGVEEPYSLEERILVMEDSLSRIVHYTDGFASDLYVVEDEHSFNESYVTSETAALFNISGRKTLYNRETFERLHPVSITKMMTAFVAIKNSDLNVRVVVTGNTAITGSGITLCGIGPGDTLTSKQLLYGLILSSGNDADTAVTVHITDSIDRFANMINQEATSLGAAGAHFVNPYGLNDPDHYTMAYDLYLIFNEAPKYPVFRQIVGTTSYTANYHSKGGQTVTEIWKDGNWFMTQGQEASEGLTVFGGKTGTTNAADYCLIMTTRGRDDKEYISVVLKSDSRPGLCNNMTNIVSEIVKQ